MYALPFSVRGKGPTKSIRFPQRDTGGGMEPWLSELADSTQFHILYIWEHVRPGMIVVDLKQVEAIVCWSELLNMVVNTYPTLHSIKSSCFLDVNFAQGGPHLIWVYNKCLLSLQRCSKSGRWVLFSSERAKKWFRTSRKAVSMLGIWLLPLL